MAAAAWLAHPAGVGAVAAAAVWPLAGRNVKERPWLRALGAAAPAAILLGLGAAFPVVAPPVAREGGFGGVGAALGGLLQWAGLGVPGPWGALTGAVLLVALAAAVVRDAQITPPLGADVPWSDPRAPDLLALSLHPAAGIVALGALLGAAAAGAATDLARPWMAASVPVAALAAATVVRGVRRATRSRVDQIALVVVVAWAGVAGTRSVRGIAEARATGRGLTAAVWVESPVIRWLDNQSAGHPVIYASDPPLVFIQSGISTLGIPPRGSDLEAFAKAFEQRPGPVVLVGGGVSQAAFLRERLGLDPAVTGPEGVVLLP